jgi:hypothetical protein
VGRFTHVAVASFDDSSEYTTGYLNKPSDLRVENVQQTSMQLSYLNNSAYADEVYIYMTGGPNRLAYKARTGPAVGVGAGMRGSLTFRDLTPGTNYALQMQVFSDSGSSDRSDELFFKTEDDPNEVSFRINGGRRGILTVPDPIIKSPYNQYLRQLRKAERGWSGMNTAQASNLVKNLGE